MVGWCYAHGVPMVPHGGGTGFAGGTVADGGVVIALERMVRIRAFDPLLWRIWVEAGLRTDDKYDPFPEEMMRRLTGSLADLHFAPTERSRDNLLRSGVAPESEPGAVVARIRELNRLDRAVLVPGLPLTVPVADPAP